MENNGCDVNCVDSDVLLPPRKRLLAGLKIRDSVVNLQTPLKGSCDGNEFDLRMNNLLRNHPNLSNDEIVVASRKAAIEASKVASAVRIVADEKAAKAAKAMAAAKSALELVAVSQEKQLKKKKKNKIQKHVAVDSLYGKRKSTQNCRTDEELARKLHQVINSSPRISMNISTDSELKSSKPKKLKISPSEKTDTHNGGTTVLETDHTFTRNGISGFNDSYDRVMKKYNDGTKFKKQDGQTFDDSNRHNQVNIGNGKAGTVLPENRVRECDDGVLIGNKKWNIKLKKLSLSIEKPKENLKAKLMPFAEDNIRKPTTSSNKALFSNMASRDERFLDKESIGPDWRMSFICTKR